VEWPNEFGKVNSQMRITAPLRLDPMEGSDSSKLGVVMLSEAQIRRVWEGMLASEIRAKYFTELSGSYLKRQRLVTWGILLFSSADAVSFLKNLPDSLVWIRAGLAVCAAGASIYLALAQYERSVIEASDLYMPSIMNEGSGASSAPRYAEWIGSQSRPPSASGLRRLRASRRRSNETAG